MVGGRLAMAERICGNAVSQLGQKAPRRTIVVAPASAAHAAPPACERSEPLEDAADFLDGRLVEP
jgi:hypothetical protein